MNGPLEFHILLLRAITSRYRNSTIRMLTGILCTFDTLKHDMEIKLLPGCTNDDLQLIQKSHGGMYTYFIPIAEVSS